MTETRDFRIVRTAAHQANYPQLFCDIEMAFWGPTGTDADKAYVAEGTPGMRALFVMTLFARLVDNGGLMGFFGSSSFYSREVTEALALLEFPEMQQAFTEGLAVLCKGESAPEDEKTGRRMLGSLSREEIEKLNGITKRLYAGSGVEDRLFNYFKTYVDAHPLEFFKD
jgi:Domain of unknown function (DUF4375)